MAEMPGFPRPRGGDPMRDGSLICIGNFSPPMRG